MVRANPGLERPG